MSDPRGTDDRLLDRILHGPAATPEDDRLRETCAEVAAALRHVPLPAHRLPGWEGLCSDEYRVAMERLQRSVGGAWSDCAGAARG